MDPFTEIDPFDETIEINMASVVRPMSEEHIVKEVVFYDCDSDDDFAIGKILISTKNNCY